jgi:hypothetical protein
MKQIQEKFKAVIEMGTKKESMLVLFLCGVLIFVILLPTDNDNNSYLYKKTEETSKYTESETVSTYKEKRETELKSFLESVSGVGEVKVLIYLGDPQDDVPTIEGIVVAAKGARDENVRLLIMKLVMALYGLEANKVEVTALL